MGKNEFTLSNDLFYNNVAHIICVTDTTAKRRLISNIYEYYDRDNNGLLTTAELTYAQKADHMETLAVICNLTDLIVFSPRAKGQDYIDIDGFNYEFGELLPPVSFTDM